MTFDEFVAMARRFEGQTLETVTGRRFRVGISHEGPHEVPRTTAPHRKGRDR